MNTPTKTPEKSKREIAKEAQAEQQHLINAKREELLLLLIEHDEIGGIDDLEASLLAIIQKHPGGIRFPFLQSLFPNASLVTVRDNLKKDKKIHQDGKKGNVVLKWGPAEAKSTE